MLKSVVSLSYNLVVLGEFLADKYVAGNAESYLWTTSSAQTKEYIHDSLLVAVTSWRWGAHQGNRAPSYMSDFGVNPGSGSFQAQGGRP
jgi:hypothetical protein